MAELLYDSVEEKSTDTQFSYEFDFEGIAPENVNVSTVTTTATRDDGVDVTDDMIELNTISSQAVTVKINTLENERAYIIVCAAVAGTADVQLALMLNVNKPGVYR